MPSKSNTFGDTPSLAPEQIGSYSTAKYWSTLKSQYGLPDRADIDYYHKYYRFGVFDPYHEIQTGREFLFFTKLLQVLNQTKF